MNESESKYINDRVIVFKRSKDDFWKGIVSKFFDLNVDYILDHYGTDAVFGYTEMSNVSLLSTACWKENWPASVEEQDKKYTGRKMEKNKKKKYKLGRVDLYFAKGQTEYICEAKQHFSNGGKIFTDTLTKKMGSALDNVLRSTKYGKKKMMPGYAIVFVPHLLSENKATDPDALGSTTEKLKAELQEACGDKRTHKAQRVDNDAYIDGYASLYLKSPIPGWTQSGDKHLIGLSILFREARLGELPEIRN